MSEETIESLQAKRAHLQKMWDECAWHAIGGRDTPKLYNGEILKFVQPDASPESRVVLLTQDGAVHFDSIESKDFNPKDLTEVCDMAKVNSYNAWILFVLEPSAKVKRFKMINRYTWELQDDKPYPAGKLAPPNSAMKGDQY